MRRRRGFTLLEILVAALLGAMLVLLTAHVFHTALSSRDRMQHRSEDLSAMNRAFDVISRDFHSAVVVPDDAGFTFGLSTTAQGTTVTPPFQFAAATGEPLLQTRTANETQLVQYVIDQDPRNGQPMLWRRTVAYPSSNTDSPFDAPDAGLLPLLPNVVGLNYTFYAADQQNWIDSWDGETGLPTAMRLDLVIQDRDPKAQPHQESWTFQLPVATFANDEANDAQNAASQTTAGTTGGAGTTGTTGTTGTSRSQ